MYENTTYKAFVAETAARIAAEISREFATPRDVSLLANDEDTQHKIAVAAICVADKLAGKLEDWWQSKGERKTVMFDPQDSLTSNIERALSGIEGELEDIKERMSWRKQVEIVDEDD